MRRRIVEAVGKNPDGWESCTYSTVTREETSSPTRKAGVAKKGYELTSLRVEST